MRGLLGIFLLVSSGCAVVPSDESQPTHCEWVYRQIGTYQIYRCVDDYAVCYVYSGRGISCVPVVAK